jgi:RimJ/RimL family protein N-acetyltransferase/predicted GNAT family acetyltransferase
MAQTLVTGRLVLRGWEAADAEAALGAYGDPEVARWLTPAMDTVADLAAMRLLLRQWAAEDAAMMTPAGRWAVELRGSGQVIGGATLLPLVPDEEFEIGWQLQPGAWGHGYGTEAGLALARWAFGQGIEQVIALVRPANARAAATVRRIGMEWVGETEKYHGLRLQEYRVRPGDLAAPPAGEPGGVPLPASAASGSGTQGGPGPGQAGADAAAVRHNPARSRFEFTDGGQLAELVYRQHGRRLVLVHTGVPPEIERHGIGSALVAAATGYAASHGLTVVPQCPFARSWLQRHPGAAAGVAIDWG